jgi:transposase
MDFSREEDRVLIFQQDNAKAHKAASVLKYFEEWGYEVLDWPPQSPDLSPKNIWNVMKIRLKAETKTTHQSNNAQCHDGNLG